jgi:FkbM family methyltransferase
VKPVKFTWVTFKYGWSSIKTLVGKPARAGHARFLRDVSGVIHVGANTGQERFLYNKFRLQVVWIEPIPEIFRFLQSNIAGFPRQQAIQSLVTDRDDIECPFHVANNQGQSSSIFDLNLHKDMWPEITVERTIILRSVTLATVLAKEHIDPLKYDALVMDTQGSELLVLKGALPVLENFKYIKTEVADFASYTGCCTIAEIDSFLNRRAYHIISKTRLASRTGVGSYYDVVYKKGD